MQRHLWLAAACAATGLALACDSLPAEPGPLERPIGGRGPGGTTVKVGAPSPVMPAGGSTIDTLTPTLLANNSRGRYSPGLDILLVFEIFDEADVRVYRSEPVAQNPSNRTSHVVAVPLAAGRQHSWRAVPVLDGREGPPSTRAVFRTP